MTPAQAESSFFASMNKEGEILCLLLIVKNDAFGINLYTEKEGVEFTIEVSTCFLEQQITAEKLVYIGELF